MASTKGRHSTTQPLADIQSFLNAFGGPVALVAQDGTIVAVNPQWNAFSIENGGKPERLGVGVNYLRVCDQAEGPWAEGAREVAKGIRQVFSGRLASFAREYPCPCSDFERWFVAHATPHEIAGKNFVMVRHEDLTERKRSLEDIGELLLSANCLLWQAQVTEIEGELLWRLDVRNEAAAQQIFPIEIAPTGDFSESFILSRHPGDLDLIDARSEYSIRSGSNGYVQDYRLRLASGEIRVLQEHARIETRGEGRWRVTGVCVDVTEQRRVEAALRFSEGQFSTAFENAAIGMALVTPTGQLARVNQALCDIVGYSADELRNRRFRDITHPEEAERDVENMRRLQDGEISTYHVEKRYLHKDGSIVWVLLGVSLIRSSEAEPLLFMAQIQDISELKAALGALVDSKEMLEARVRERTAELVASNHDKDLAIEQARTADLAKSKFLSRMSHELRTPLNAILGFSQILERQKLTDRQAESVGYILEAGRHLLGLINEVLDISQVEAGNTDMHFEAVDPYEVAVEVVGLVRPIALGRQISVNAAQPAPAGGFVRADRRRLRQVLLNLASNAVKYNHEGGRVEIRMDRSGEGRVRIAVQDWGPGIAKQDLPKLFAPFERLSSANSEVEGTGLGLTLSRTLVVAMGGEIFVESLEGQGSTFFVELESAP